MKNEFDKIKGRQGKDKVTGFKGMITGMASYLTGCNQYLLVPKVKKDGSSTNGEWFDETRVKVSGKKFKVDQGDKKNGADIPAPIK